MGAAEGRGWGTVLPVEHILGGLTSARFKGWQHRHEHVVQEERAAVHPDGARQEAAEVADVSDRERVSENISPSLGGIPLYHFYYSHPPSPLEGLPFLALPSQLPAHQKVLPCV